MEDKNEIDRLLIPSKPYQAYSSEWTNWGDFLGSGNLGPKDYEFRSFKEAREFVHDLKLKNYTAWREWSRSDKRPFDIPADPAAVYREEWINLGDWLGTGNISNREREFLPFEEARSFAHGLKLNNQTAWREWCQSGEKHSDIPHNPDRVYSDKWVSFGDWLGTGSVATFNREYRPFEDAKKFVHSLKLPSMAAWRKWYKSEKIIDIPASPHKVYQEWIDWGDWLGTGSISPTKIHENFRPFKEARKFARELCFTNVKEWRKWCKSDKRPTDIPTCPYGVYNEWGNWGDWLGTGQMGTRNRKYRSFEDAKKFVQKLGLTGQKDWGIWCKSGKRPHDIPRNPSRIYTKEWIGFGDWLGTGNLSPKNRKYLPFEEARRLVRALHMRNTHEWRKWATSDRPIDIPSNPQGVYDEWTSWGDWLGNENVANRDREFLSFEKARKFARGLKLKGTHDWRKWNQSGKRPNNIPVNPSQAYSKEWQGMGDWLGTGNLSPKNRKYLSFEEAREFIRSLKLNGTDDWRKWCRDGKRPKNIPSAPWKAYKSKWINLGDWLGTGNIGSHNRVFLPFFEARQYVNSLKMKNTNEWLDWCKSYKKPANIPTNPKTIYLKEWLGMGDWLGTGNKHEKDFCSFKEAKVFVRSLKLKSWDEWRKWCKTDQRPSNISSHPERTYSDKWISWGDWLGTGSVATQKQKRTKRGRAVNG